MGTQTYDMQPDIITCAKALTSAYMPLSAILLSERIYDGMKAQSEKIGVFGHGYTYGAHPVACAVGVETLRIYEEDGIIDDVKRLGAHMGKLMHPLIDHPLVGEVRGVGLMWGLNSCATRRRAKLLHRTCNSESAFRTTHSKMVSSAARWAQLLPSRRH